MCQISDHCKRINTEWNTVTAGVDPASSGFKLKKCNFLNFCQIFRIFLPKCRAFNVVLETGYGAGNKGMTLEKMGMTLEKKDMARRHAKTG